MAIDALPSVATLAVVFWVVGVLLPKAIKERSGFALVCAILCVLLALITWFLFGAKGLRS